MNRDQKLLNFFKVRCNYKVRKLTNGMVKKVTYLSLSEHLKLDPCQMSRARKGLTKKLICNLPVIERMASYLEETPIEFLDSFYNEDYRK